MLKIILRFWSFAFFRRPVEVVEQSDGAIVLVKLQVMIVVEARVRKTLLNNGAPFQATTIVL